MPTRRDFNLGLVSAAFGGLALAACGKLGEYARRLPGLRVDAMQEAAGMPPLVPDARHDVFDLMDGLRYDVVASSDPRFCDPRSCVPAPMTDGRARPDSADGMGAFRLDDPNQVVLVRNHELDVDQKLKGPFPSGAPAGIPAYDGEGGQPLPGGTTRIVYDLAKGERVSETLTLVGTVRNCAGGVTPWGSWLTCEEPQDLRRASHRPPHGFVFEVPALQEGLAEPVRLDGLGRFNHEAAAVDPRTGIVYMTEDRGEGLFYRFVPERPGELAAGGRLQALAFARGFDVDARNWTTPHWRKCDPRPVEWVTLDGTDSPLDDLRRRGHRKQGAVRFAYGEGVHFGDNEIYFCCTSGGRIRSGQIMRYRLSPGEGEGDAAERRDPGTLEIFVEVTDPGVLNYADNLNVAPNGHLIVCEDTYVAGEDGAYVARPIAEKLGGRPSAYLRGVTPEGAVYDIGRLRARSELAGVCFSPDGQVLFVNHYSPATTFAIRSSDDDRPPPWLVGGAWPRWKVFQASGRDWEERSRLPRPQPPRTRTRCEAEAGQPGTGGTVRPDAASWPSPA